MGARTCSRAAAVAAVVAAVAAQVAAVAAPEAWVLQEILPKDKVDQELLLRLPDLA